MGYLVLLLSNIIMNYGDESGDSESEEHLINDNLDSSPDMNNIDFFQH
jgi:hypothetical protein